MRAKYVLEHNVRTLWAHRIMFPPCRTERGTPSTLNQITEHYNIHISTPHSRKVLARTHTSPHPPRRRFPPCHTCTDVVPKTPASVYVCECVCGCAYDARNKNALFTIISHAHTRVASACACTSNHMSLSHGWLRWQVERTPGRHRHRHRCHRDRVQSQSIHAKPVLCVWVCV